ncbi:MAG: HAMP domain-containing sensor histidine kinase [Candidatus Saccharibacteria bacterium]
MDVVQGKQGEAFKGLLVNSLPSLVAAAHELKSPLTLVRQLSLMLESDNVSLSDQKRMLRQISLTSERALRLTNDLTRSARLTDAMFTMEPINPQQLCEDIVYELGPLFLANDRNVRLKSYKHPLLLVANRDLLRRIIMSFSDNALHYTGDDCAVEIQIKAFNSGKIIRLGVRDYGPALSSDMWKSLKGKLSKSNMPINARPQSSGLGLYIASQFANAMNGSIGVIRHRDGATFYVDLQASKQLSLL